MPLEKQSLNINFSLGLDTKSDPKQVKVGKFLQLSNSVFGTEGALVKRNGYGRLTNLPDTTSNFVTTFSGNLTAIGTDLKAYSQGSDTWVNKGTIHAVQLETLALIRSNLNQSQADSVVSANNLVCTVYTDNLPDGSGSTDPVYKYVVADATTGQNIIAPTEITPSSGTVSGSPRVFLLGNYFIIVFTNIITATPHLQYMSISTTNPTMISANVDISAQYAPESTVAFDGFVVNDTLYLAWNGSDLGGAIRMTYLDANLALHNTVPFAGELGTIVSVTADSTVANPVIYVSYYDLPSQVGKTLAVNTQLFQVLAPTSIISAITVNNITSTAQDGILKVFYEVDNEYTYDTIKTNYIESLTVTQGGSVSSPAVVVRSLGLASKAFLLNDTSYFLGIYDSLYQPTYFLINDSGNVVCKLAYSNAGPYYTLGLPNVTVAGTQVQIPYLIKDLVQAVNKEQGAANAAGVYSQTGINLATFDLSTSRVVTSEIANDLHLSGGFLWMYDGYTPVEHMFHLYPDYVEVDTSGTGGDITAQEYFYVATYEWADNQGNMFRSAPSIPVSVTTTGSTSTNTVNIPTLRLTYKISNPVKLVVYRWSTAQQTYYQVTSIQVPTLNDTSVDSIEFEDTLDDSAIIGNNILYTTGGVLENIAAPAVSTMTLWQSRLFYLQAEDRNTVGFSKQVIPGVPVETSDLLTIYFAPTTGAQGSTGPLRCLASMDDKLIGFKSDAIYYVTGNGPDNTGANGQYSDPVFVTSTVGCSNQQSIVFMPQGIMFQSDKGIWMLGRDLSTSFIGSPVQEFTDNAIVQSAVNVPGTNQVRFTMDSGITLMYDYYYGQWGTFTNVPAISSTLYESLHTYINQYGQVFQETPEAYLDGSSPVLMSFKTSWLNLAGVQGYQRAYFFYLIGEYITPHKLAMSIAYDYNESPTQTSIISPDNYTAPWGGEQLWGSGEIWGGSPSLEQWRVFLQNQKCEAFQIQLQEIYDPSYGVTAGAGFTLSGLDIILGIKSGYPRLKAARSVG